MGFAKKRHGHVHLNASLSATGGSNDAPSKQRKMPKRSKMAKTTTMNEPQRAPEEQKTPAAEMFGVNPLATKKMS